MMEYLEDSSEEEEETETTDVVVKRTIRQRINFFTFYHSEFMERFRLRPSEDESVLRVLGPSLKHKTDKNFALSPQQQFLLTLHWLALGTTLYGISDMHGVSKATVCRAVQKVVTLIVNQISHNVIRWPANCSGIALEILRKGGFPSVCGAVDGTLVNLIGPSQFEEQYVNRHGKHSLNVMVICGPDYIFYYVNSRFPGSVHDSRVLRASRISEKFSSGWRPFSGAVLLGDSGYGLRSWLIPPIRSNPDDPREQRFNQAHKCTRRIVENAIGILKNRFMVLKLLRVKPQFAALVVLSCASVHNIACKKDFMVNLPQMDVNEEQPPHGELVDDIGGQQKLAELLAHF